MVRNSAIYPGGPRSESRLRGMTPD